MGGGGSKSQGGLEFRDLHIFNRAMLAKQLRRLHPNPQSLVAHIFQAKYFAQKSVLEAELGNRPSYAWRSLMAAKSVLTKGLIWRVGDGRSINI
jgi:hypothetical protein